MLKAAQFLAVCLALVLPAPLTHGRDNGQYTQADPKVQQWFRDQRDRNNVSCCDTADGARLEDPDWDCDSQEKCRVKLDDGKWHDVPPVALLRGQGLGYAIVWRWFDPDNGWTVRCFQPGSRA